MRNLKFITIIASVVYLVLSIINTAVYVVYAINGFNDPTYYNELINQVFAMMKLSEEEISILASVLAWYYLILAVQNGLGVFLDVFYIQACRRGFLKSLAPYIVFGVLGIVFGQLFPGILFIVLGAKTTGKNPPNDPNVIDNQPE